jgi:hypothetical protein
MKKLILLLALTFNYSTLASKFNCSVEVNGSAIFSDTVKVHDGEKVQFFSKGQYKLFINQRGSSEFELEVLDLTVPSRSYAKSNLEKSNDIIEYSLWSRDILFELKCELI